MLLPPYSLIIPIYNVAKFLPMCLDSLLQQTVSPTEIIAVNDGSTDDSLQILNSYSKKFPQIKVIHQDNKGVSIARNVGLAHAIGEYVAFPDADDFVESDFYPNLLKLAVIEKLEVALGNGYYYENNHCSRKIFSFDNETISTGESWMTSAIASRHFIHVVYLHIYQHDFLRRHQFQFIPGRRHQDVVWTTEVLLAAKRVAYFKKPGYYYRLWRGSASRPKTDVSIIGVIDSTLDNAKDLHRILSTRKLLPETRGQLAFLQVDGGCSAFHDVEKIQDQQLRWEATRCPAAASKISGLSGC
ncbi:MAG: glycosyltransferase, partial [Deltaproteobacteria bacterium]|nr:glycosyltransferase [Deltaproteobacteria bacterium]